MDWFPEPYPDETFYSVLVRLHRYLGSPPYANFARAIAGRRHFVALAHLPCGLAGVAEHFGWAEEKLEQVIRQTTAFGYHTAFASQEVRDEVLAQMKRRGATLQFILGLSTFPVPTPQALQFCAACIAEQRRHRGEAWWMRSQQLPGVVACAKHRTWLTKSAIEIAPENRHLLIGPEEAAAAVGANQSADTSDTPSPGFVELARRSRLLLDASPPARTPAAIHSHYREVLAARGLLRGTEHLHIARIHDLVRETWGEALEKVPGLSFVATDQSNWVRDILRNRRRLAPPAQHLVLRAALEAATKVERPFGPPPWPCLNPLAEHFEKAVVTRQRLVRDRGKLHGHFTCVCGYSYSRTHHPDGSIGRPHLRDYGPTAERFLRKVAAKGLSLRGKARAMGVDPMTVKRLEARFGSKPMSEAESDLL